MAVSSRSVVTELISDLFHVAMDLQALYLRDCPFHNLSMSEMHVLEAVSLEEMPTMSHVAKRLMVTTGTLTTAANKIIEKGYLCKEKSASDRRLSFLRLTDSGLEALKVHDSFHQALEAIILNAFQNDDYEWIVQRMKIILESLEKERCHYLKS